jgi:oligosaccharide repeat unit polymerase
MSITSSSSLPSSCENSGPYLTWVRPALVLATGLGLLLPVILWASWMEPEGLLRFSPGWNNLFLGLAVTFFAILLLLAPLVWMTIWRSLDVVGLTLAHQGLILLGYFFIERTAASLGVAELAAVQEGLPWIVMINLVGFSILLPVLAVTYAWDRKQGYRLKPLPAPAEDLDRKLIPFLRILAVILCGLIVLPMVMTGALPMIGGGEGEDVRYQMLSSSSSRPLYHFATGLVPVVAGALSVSILRRWRRFPLHDMVLLLLMAGLQVVSGNRLPLAIALFMTATLVTMQSRLPRWIFPPLYTLFLTLFMFLGGFSSLMRTDRERLREGDPFLTSLGEVYLGNNVIDLRDGAWVMGHWDFEPLLGQTYLGGLVAMAPSGLFPKKHDWHLGLTAVRLVGMDDRSHFGLRITFFGEAFLNFGWPGVAALAVLMGTLWATLLRAFHLILLDDPGCLTRNLQVVVLMQMCNPLTNTSDAFTFWTLLIFLVMLWLAVVRQARIADQRPGVL